MGQSEQKVKKRNYKKKKKNNISSIINKYISDTYTEIRETARWVDASKKL